MGKENWWNLMDESRRLKRMILNNAENYREFRDEWIELKMIN